MRPGRNRGWLLRLVIAFSFAQAAVSMARPAVSYRALALGADERAVGVIAGVYALLPLFAAVPLGRRTDHGRCAPLLPFGVVLISGGCALSGVAGSLWTMALWSGVMGLGHLCFVIGSQSLVARQSAPHEQDRNFGHFTIGAALGQLVGPVAAGALIGGDDMAGTSALALIVAGGVAAVSFTSLWRIEHRRTAATSRADKGDRVPVRRILRTRGVPAGMLHQPRRAVRDRHPHRLPPGGRRAPGHRAIRDRRPAQPARGGHHRLPPGADAPAAAARPGHAAHRDLSAGGAAVRGHRPADAGVGARPAAGRCSASASVSGSRCP